MLSLLAWQTPKVFRKQNRDVCVRQQVDQFVIQSMAITLSHWLSHIHIYICSCKHLLYNAEASTMLYWATSFYIRGLCTFFPSKSFFWFMNSFGLYGFKHNYASNRVLFDPCQFSLKPYVFSWHLYHIVRLIQTQLSVYICDFVSSHGGILAWLLVAALPACLCSSADLMTQRSRCSLKQAVGYRHIWTHSVWLECWYGYVRGWLNIFLCSYIFQKINVEL